MIMTAKKKPDQQGLEIVLLPVDALQPNPWNVNRIAPKMLHKLREYLRKEGLVEPLVVRQMPDGHYQILGGFHRWKLCKEELGYSEVPCVVVEMNDKRAKILSINLNEMKGAPVQHLLSELIYDLSKETTLDDLATMLPYEEAQLFDALELLKLPDGLDKMLEDQAEKEAQEAPKVLSFVVDDPAPIETAIESIASGLDGKNRRGRALVKLAENYLEEKRDETVNPARE
jgi:ParB/RepB/Spo0J family partition protein